VNACNASVKYFTFAKKTTLTILKNHLHFGFQHTTIFSNSEQESVYVNLFKRSLLVQIKTVCLGVYFIIFMFWIQPASSEDIQTAPIPVQAAIFLKLLEFDKNISSGGSITIYVQGSPGFAAAMKKAEGKAVGAATIGKVIEGSGLPSEKPSAVYIGAESVLSQMQTYTTTNKVLSMTGIPELASKGITLTVGISEGKPKIMLNLSSSKDEGIDWNPAILKVAATVK
jgi:hypothetical protein